MSMFSIGRLPAGRDKERTCRLLAWALGNQHVDTENLLPHSQGSRSRRQVGCPVASRTTVACHSCFQERDAKDRLVPVRDSTVGWASAELNALGQPLCISLLYGRLKFHLAAKQSTIRDDICCQQGILLVGPIGEASPYMPIPLCVL